MNKTCNRCKKELEEYNQEIPLNFGGTLTFETISFVCTNINCPIKGCLQVPLENMPKEKSGSLRYNP